MGLHSRSVRGSATPASVSASRWSTSPGTGYWVSAPRRVLVRGRRVVQGQVGNGPRGVAVPAEAVAVVVVAVGGRPVAVWTMPRKTGHEAARVGHAQRGGQQRYVRVVLSRKAVTRSTSSDVASAS